MFDDAALQPLKPLVDRVPARCNLHCWFRLADGTDMQRYVDYWSTRLQMANFGHTRQIRHWILSEFSTM